MASPWWTSQRDLPPAGLVPARPPRASHHPCCDLVYGVHVLHRKLRVEQVDVEGPLDEYADVSQGEGVDEPACDQRIVVGERIAGVPDELPTDEVSELLLDLRQRCHAGRHGVSVGEFLKILVP